MPIVQVAAGQGQVLALTIDYEMFSWGQGDALGFGNGIQEMPYPKKLIILDHKGYTFRITQVCCGKFHSMCLTKNHNIYSWGEGSYGRLGHGADNEDDQYEPKEIYALS
jgi:alpha-tubulin suppressor-like RCC1 family protein